MIDPLTVVHSLAPGPAGGLETVVRRLSTGLAARGHRVHVAPVLEPGREVPPTLERARQAGVLVTPIVVATRNYLGEGARLHGLLDRVGADVLHTHGYRSDVVGLGVARLRALPALTTVHGFTGGDARNRLYERLQLLAFRRFDAVVAVSAPLREQLVERGIDAGRLHLIRNAPFPAPELSGRSDARRRLDLPPDRVVVGWVGRLSREKGPDLAIEALARLEDDSVSLSLIGDGPLRSSLEARATSLGLEDRVRFHGLVDGAARLYRAFDLFLLSSRTEGTPMVVFEAVQAEVPVVSTSVGGVPDILSEGEAFLVDAPEPGALAAGIRRALSRPDIATEKAAAALRTLERDPGGEGWLAAYERLYRSITRSDDG